MALAGYPLIIRGGASATPTDEIDGINSVRYGPSRAMLNTTDFRDTTDFITRIAGLKDGTIEISGDYEHTDTAQAACRTAWANGTLYYVRILWDGTNGVEVPCLVESFNIEPAVEDKVSFSASLLFSGAITTV